MGHKLYKAVNDTFVATNDLSSTSRRESRIKGVAEALSDATETLLGENMTPKQLSNVTEVYEREIRDQHVLVARGDLADDLLDGMWRRAWVDHVRRQEKVARSSRSSPVRRTRIDSQ